MGHLMKYKRLRDRKNARKKRANKGGNKMKYTKKE
jgi:hypothetical protein